jgi:phosphoserine phosphatase
LRHVLTLIAAPGKMLNSEDATMLLESGKVFWLEKGIACDILPRPGQEHLAPLIHLPDFDYVLQPLAAREKKLFIADMDSTMIEQECIDELADLVGKKAEVAAITERAMNGELDFKSALRARVALLEGLSERDLMRVYEERITPTPGARALIQTLKARGIYTMLVSGGFRFFTSRVAAALGFDSESANELEMENGALTGRIVEPILDKTAKLLTLQKVAEHKKIPLEATVAVGDGANDLPMLQEAGLGVAYHAKPLVRSQTKAQINFNDLSALLYVLGIPKKDWIE